MKERIFAINNHEIMSCLPSSNQPRVKKVFLFLLFGLGKPATFNNLSSQEVNELKLLFSYSSPLNNINNLLLTKQF